jgi:hypothetical protein
MQVARVLIAVGRRVVRALLTDPSILPFTAVPVCRYIGRLNQDSERINKEMIRRLPFQTLSEVHLTEIELLASLPSTPFVVIL